MYSLLAAIRRLCVAALAIALFACVVEVALRWSDFHDAQRRGAADLDTAPVLPSRSTGSELASAWTGMCRHAETGQPFMFRVNSLGLRGPELQRVLPAQRLRILCLGDETTLAAGLTEEEAYPGRLATLIRDAAESPPEVINAGLPGGAPLTEYILYRRLLAPLRPQVVILHLDISDARDDQLARPRLRVDESGDPVAVVHPSLEVPAGPLDGVARRFALGQWLHDRIGARLAGAPATTALDQFQQELLAWETESTAAAVNVPMALEPLARLHSALQTDGATLVVATIPNAWQAAELLRKERTASGENPLLHAPATTARRACGELGVLMVDATPDVLRHPDPARLYLREGTGLSTEGHTLYARTIARALTGGSLATR